MITKVKGKIDSFLWNINHKRAIMYELPDKSRVSNLTLGYELSGAREISYAIFARANIFAPWDLDPNSIQENT